MTFKYSIKGRARLTAAVCAALLSACLCCAPVSAAELSLVPVGRTVGIRLQTPGALVVALTKTEGACPAEAAGIRAGDLIIAMQGQTIDSAAAFMEAAAALDGSPVRITVEREGAEKDFTVTPAPLGGGWMIGVWLRDSISGIGTVTFLDPETGFYGALGHPINDVDTGVCLPVGEGKVMPAEVTGVCRGQSGAPGELSGSFDFESCCGSILVNSPCGIFGYLENFDAGEAVPVASDEEIHAGKASILSNVEGSSVGEYGIEIEQVFHGSRRTLCFRVTDETLLALTGGIVQGMSGSPIMQDGKLIGAVTHVLVSDPSRGYGVSMEQMLSAADALAENQAA